MIISRYERPYSDPNLNPVDKDDPGDDEALYCESCDDFHLPGEHIPQ